MRDKRERAMSPDGHDEVCVVIDDGQNSNKRQLSAVSFVRLYQIT